MHLNDELPHQAASRTRIRSSCCCCLLVDGIRTPVLAEQNEQIVFPAESDGFSTNQEDHEIDRDGSTNVMSASWHVYVLPAIPVQVDSGHLPELVPAKSKGGVISSPSP